MVEIQILEMPSADAVASKAAALLVESFSKRPVSGDAFSVALSGGRISPIFFKSLATLLRDSHLPLEALHFFWADERCVPVSHPDSNYAVANTSLFRHLGISHSQIHRIKGEVAPADAAAEAAAEICRITPLDQSRQPMLDFVILGMGEDGHTASLFPGEAIEQQLSPAVYRPVVAPKPPPQRITLGYPAIAAARRMLALITGADKREPLRAALSPEAATPMGKVLQARRRIGGATVLTDFTVE